MEDTGTVLSAVAAVLAVHPSVWSDHHPEVCALTATCQSLYALREQFFATMTAHVERQVQHDDLYFPSNVYAMHHTSHNNTNNNDGNSDSSSQISPSPMKSSSSSSSSIVKKTKRARPHEERFIQTFAQLCFEQGLARARDVDSEEMKRLLRVAASLFHPGALRLREDSSLTVAESTELADLLRIPQPSVHVQCRIGDHYYSKLNYQKAILYFRPAAARGFHMAQYRYGNMLGWGEACETDELLALEQHVLAAIQGNSCSVMRLATYHDNGWGVALNREEGKKLREVAVQMGSPEAMYLKASDLLAEHSGKEDERVHCFLAFRLLDTATLLGSDKAATVRERMCREMASMCNPMGSDRPLWNRYFYCLPTTMRRQLVTFYLCAMQTNSVGPRDVVLLVCDWIASRPLLLQQ